MFFFGNGADAKKRGDFSCLTNVGETNLFIFPGETKINKIQGCLLFSLEEEQRIDLNFPKQVHRPAETGIVIVPAELK